MQPTELERGKCAFCGEELTRCFVDLGSIPLSNAFVDPVHYEKEEKFFPLSIYVCDNCLLAQNPFYRAPREIYNDEYIYFSSISSSFVSHAKKYVSDAIQRFKLDEKSFVIEIGSNDGYLLQHMRAAGIPCLGIDPSVSAATVAQLRGIHTITNFFSANLARQLAKENISADLVCGINVFAHLPTINDFIEGIHILLKPGGVMTMEFPHLQRLVEEVQFDTICHEHYFYHTLHVVKNMLEAHGFSVFDVEEHPTHGGSLRVFAQKIAGAENSLYPTSLTVGKILKAEEDASLANPQGYSGFQEKIVRLRHSITRFLLDAHQDGKIVMGYGAAAKGITLLNYFGIRSDLLPNVADMSTHKQGKLLPGSRIPVISPDKIREVKPDYLFILAWNIADEIAAQHSYIREWGGKFVTAIPTIRIF